MKVRHFFFMAAAALFSLTACQEKDPDIGPASLTLSTTNIEIPEAGGSETIQITSTIDWAVKDYSEYSSWISISPDNGKASKDPQTVTIKVTANTGANRTAAIVFWGNVLNNEYLNIAQAGPKGDDDAEQISVKEFISRADGATDYILVGKISNIANTSFYGFDLTDDTGTISIAFPTNFKEYVSQLSTGGTVKVKGKYAFYDQKQTHQMQNGTILEYTPGEEEDITKVQQITVKEFIDRADATTTYRLKGTVNSDVNTKYCSFDLKDATSTIKVYTVNNASEWGNKVKKGGTVTLRGKFQLYNGTPEVVDAYIEEFEEGEDAKPITGTNILEDGGFEAWTDGRLDKWTFAKNNFDHVKQSTDAYDGSYSVEITGDTQYNERLMSDVYKLSAGTYQIEAYIYGPGMFRLGYAIVTDGAVASNDDYKYLNSATQASNGWKKEYVQFTLAAETEVSIIVMNSKNGGGTSIFVDDVALITNDGSGTNTGSGEGSGEGSGDDGGQGQGGGEITLTKLDPTNVKEGNYVIAYTSGSSTYIMKNEVKQSYYVVADKYDLATQGKPSDDYIFTIKASGKGYTIANSKGTYVACEVSGTHYNLVPASSTAYVWSFAAGEGGSVVATGDNTGDKHISCVLKYTEFSMSNYPEECPTFYCVD